jgi:hypothetical protein
VPEDGQDPQNPREQCDGGLQLCTHFRSSQPDYLPTSLLQVAGTKRWPVTQPGAATRS